MQQLADAVGSTTQAWVGGLFMGVASVLVLSALLPFAASLVLDGLVILIARGQLRGVVLGLLFTAVMWCVGVGLSAVASSSLAPGALAGLQQDIPVLLPVTSVLTVLAFVARQVKHGTRRR